MKGLLNMKNFHYYDPDGKPTMSLLTKEQARARSDEVSKALQKLKDY